MIKNSPDLFEGDCEADIEASLIEAFRIDNNVYFSQLLDNDKDLLTRGIVENHMEDLSKRFRIKYLGKF
jgi:hypothetical protein